MRILGIDPGIALVGWGVIDSDCGRFSVVDYGCIKTTSDMSTEDRLKSVYDQLDEIIEKYGLGGSWGLDNCYGCTFEYNVG